MPAVSIRLSVDDHSRDSAGMLYVYPVVSRRARGVSVGINLNPNNACNWRCIYCQVPDLKRGGPPPIDLDRLKRELDVMLDDIVTGDFLSSRVPEDQRRLIDIAFSGNGEPTSAAEFPEAVEIAAAALAARNLLPAVKLRLITNGSLLDRRGVRAGIARIGAAGGEVWFKVDAGSSAAVARINGSRVKMDSIERRLRQCGELCPTWVQTCLFALDGQLPSDGEISELVEFLGRCRDSIRGVHLYGLARPSAQSEAARLSPVPVSCLEGVAARMKKKGLTVEISP
jgi:wyosine [tRNA(Phe)-imidazoG37] synthetase (radical SAM superfamily)